MSAFAIKISSDHVIIASDTLVYRKHKGQPVITCNYNCKTHYLPTYKACAVIVGHTHLAVDILSFIRLKVEEREVEQMVSLIKDYFLETIDLNHYVHTGTEGTEPDELGLIDLVAYKDDLKRFKHYTIWITRTEVTVEEEVCELEPNESVLISHPKISDDHKAIIDGTPFSNEDRMVAYLKQMFTDSLSEETQSVFLGGEVMVTIMGLKPHFHCLSYVAHEFPDLSIFHNEVKPRLARHRGTETFKIAQVALSKYLDIQIGRNLETHRAISEAEIEALGEQINNLSAGSDDYFKLLGMLQGNRNVLSDIEERLNARHLLPTE